MSKPDIQAEVRINMRKAWDDFKKQHAFLLFEYPKRRASEAAMESVKSPNDAKKREKAVVEMARYETTDEILKKVALIFGEVL